MIRALVVLPLPHLAAASDDQIGTLAEVLLQKLSGLVPCDHVEVVRVSLPGLRVRHIPFVGDADRADGSSASGAAKLRVSCQSATNNYTI